jgi:hypothetical protein
MHFYNTGASFQQVQEKHPLDTFKVARLDVVFDKPPQKNNPLTKQRLDFPSLILLPFEFL